MSNVIKCDYCGTTSIPSSSHWYEVTQYGVTQHYCYELHLQLALLRPGWTLQKSEAVEESTSGPSGYGKWPRGESYSWTSGVKP